MREMIFRVLAVDDDAKMLATTVERMSGISVMVGNRLLKPQIDQLLVEVDLDAEGGRAFNERTLFSILALARNAYDYVILDYSYAAPKQQRIQWGLDERARQADSNEHLLTVADLKQSAFVFAAVRGGDAPQLVSRFFELRAPVLLRSFQHDRAHDILGPYVHREHVTRSTFSRLQRLDSLDSFSMVYGSDASLREELYSSSGRGRELYRNVVAVLTQKQLEMAMTSYLAKRASKLLLPRGAGAISLLVVLVAALSTLIQSLVGPLLASLREGELIGTIFLGLLLLLGLGVGSVALAALAERGFGRLFYDER